MEIVCRKRTQTDVWHICIDCTGWPSRNYSEKWVELTSIDPSTICLQCLQRRRERKCRMSGPQGLYDLEKSGTRRSQLNILADRWRARLKSLYPPIWNGWLPRTLKSLMQSCRD